MLANQDIGMIATHDISTSTVKTSFLVLVSAFVDVGWMSVKVAVNIYKS